MTLVDKIRDLASRAPMRQAELARRADLSRSSLSRFISGRAGLSSAALDRLGTVLRVEAIDAATLAQLRGDQLKLIEQESEQGQEPISRRATAVDRTLRRLAKQHV